MNTNVIMIKAKSKNMIINGDKEIINNLFTDNTNFLNYLNSGKFSEDTIQKSLSIGIGKLIKDRNRISN